MRATVAGKWLSNRPQMNISPGWASYCYPGRARLFFVMKIRSYVILFLLASIGLTGALASEARIWTDLQGRAITATLLEVEGDQVVILRDDGMRFSIPLSTFSEADREYVRRWASENRAPQQAGPWPTRVQVQTPRVEIVEERSPHFIYRTEHFEFRSDVRLTRTLVAEFGRIFEATFEAVEAIPLGLVAAPAEGGFYITRLFSSVQEYQRAGGTPGSAGVYKPATREVLVAFEYLGVRRTSSGFTFDRHADSGTLIHEITHQLMHDWLRKLPVWLIEGTAVYMQLIPYDRGAFQFQRIDLVQAAQQRGRAAGGSILPVEALLGVDHRGWKEHLGMRQDLVARNYFSAWVLTYYFFHMDGGGDAERMRRYLEAVRGGLAEQEAARLHLLDGRTPAELESQLLRAFQRQKVSLEVAR
jgi:hypothetical protein